MIAPLRDSVATLASCSITCALGLALVVTSTTIARATSPPQPAPESPLTPAPFRDSRESLGRVVLVQTSAAERRTAAELQAVGFEVIFVAPQSPKQSVERQHLQAVARANDALAAVHLWRAPDRGEAEIWLVDRVTGKTSVRHVDVSGADANEADEILAVRVVELLRASLLEIHEPSVRGEVPPSPQLDRFVPARTTVLVPQLFAPRFGLRGGFTVVGTPGGLGIMAGPVLGAMIGLGPRRRLGLDAEFYGTPVQSHLTTTAGEASVGIAIARVHLLAWPRPDKRVSPGLGAGIGMLIGWTHGRGQAGYQGRRDATVVALPSAAFDLAVAIVPRFRFRLGVRVGMTVPRLNVVLPDDRNVRAGWPLLDGFFTLEWVG